MWSRFQRQTAPEAFEQDHIFGQPVSDNINHGQMFAQNEVKLVGGGRGDMWKVIETSDEYNGNAKSWEEEGGKVVPRCSDRTGRGGEL